MIRTATIIPRLFLGGWLTLYVPVSASAQSPSVEQAENAEQSARELLSEGILAQPAEEIAVGFCERVREQFAAASREDSADARRVVTAAFSIIDRIKPASDDARTRLEELRESVTFYRRLLDAGDASIGALETRLVASPDDFENFLLYEIKFEQIDEALYEKEPFDTAMERL